MHKFHFINTKKILINESFIFRLLFSRWCWNVKLQLNSKKIFGYAREVSTLLYKNLFEGTEKKKKIYHKKAQQLRQVNQNILEVIRNVYHFYISISHFHDRAKKKYNNFVLLYNRNSSSPTFNVIFLFTSYYTHYTYKMCGSSCFTYIWLQLYRLNFGIHQIDEGKSKEIL